MNILGNANFTLSVAQQLSSYFFCCQKRDFSIKFMNTQLQTYEITVLIIKMYWKNVEEAEKNGKWMVLQHTFSIRSVLFHLQHDMQITYK